MVLFHSQMRCHVIKSGFVPGDSTSNHFVHIYNTFCRAPDEGKEVCAVFCVVSKAFQKIGTKAYYTNLNLLELMTPRFNGLLTVSKTEFNTSSYQAPNLIGVL